MGRRSGGELPARVEGVRRQVEHWRRTRRKRTRMPEPLWQAAVDLAGVHGLHPVARGLRLNYQALKQRVQATRGGGRPGRASGSPVFVELEAGRLPGTAQCEVELVDRRGAKMTVRLRGPGELDLVGLVGAFWSRRK